MALPTPQALSPETVPANMPKLLGLFDASMIVAGSMIGSGIFIVTGQMARDVGGAGWLILAWGITTLITLAAALSYGELAAMMPRTGSPQWVA